MSSTGQMASARRFLGNITQAIAQANRFYIPEVLGHGEDMKIIKTIVARAGAVPDGVIREIPVRDPAVYYTRRDGSKIKIGRTLKCVSQADGSIIATVEVEDAYAKVINARKGRVAGRINMEQEPLIP